MGEVKKRIELERGSDEPKTRKPNMAHPLHIPGNEGEALGARGIAHRSPARGCRDSKLGYSDFLSPQKRSNGDNFD
jgi:hypothetical protein